MADGDITVTINMDQKCEECGRGGRSGNGLCLKCTSNAMKPKRKMLSETGKAVQARLLAILNGEVKP